MDGAALRLLPLCHKSTTKGGEVTSASPWAEAARQGACTCPITHSPDVHLQGGGRCLCSHGCKTGDQREIASEDACPELQSCN